MIVVCIKDNVPVGWDYDVTGREQQVCFLYSNN